jgi:hypothetical protein
MASVDLFLGKNLIQKDEPEVSGQLVTIDDEEFFEIRNYDSMLPFFMSLASDSNHWMFISSTGGLSAGRVNPDNALFPYYTDDKIHESAETTGSKTILHVAHEGKMSLWEPFSSRYNGIYKTERNIYKSTTGNKLIFEEKNLELGLTFRYGWMNADKFGWIKKNWLLNDSNRSTEVYILDGIQNILPFGVQRFEQTQYSTLLDAYKKCELIKNSNLALFRMESIPVDKAEPSEALKVTTVWTCGLESPSFLLSSRQLDNFRKGKTIDEEDEAKGIKGAFFAKCKLTIQKGDKKEWYFIADVSQDSVQVNNLIDYLGKNKTITKSLEEEICKGTDALRSIVGEADGIQQSADKLVASRHFSNVLFNVMRGGIFSEGFNINKADFLKHIKQFNRRVWEKHSGFLSELPESLKYESLRQNIEARGDEDLKRLCLEYLPLTFSRRHGDPSRPWNLFSINIKDHNGNKLLYYQGNWRDIFQNWEALSLSYPDYISGMIAKFLNASTADGYNPYRVTREGIDWEVPDPDNPWSNIGYWGDHQVIYLNKLMEVSQNFFPSRLTKWLSEEMFAYANVPYRIKSYSEIVRNPHDSIVFEKELNEKIGKLVAEMGAEGKLIQNSSGGVLKVNLTEKLLATILSKLSNFIPEAGIWMNTLRPEWNDANNALVGYGVSMVTLYYMRRLLSFLVELFNGSAADNFVVSDEIAECLRNINKVLQDNLSTLPKGFDDVHRKLVMDQLGNAGSDYRNKIYSGFSGKKSDITKKDLLDFIGLALKYIDQSIDANKRTDKMYNAYNLISITDDKASIRYLYEMLEGQVAILSSGKLSSEEVLGVLESMRGSLLYRADQESYILYPNKRLPWFLEKNNVPVKDIKKSHILSHLLQIGNTGIIARDSKGQYHFNGSFRNAGHLRDALQKFRKESAMSYTEEEFKEVLDIYEKMFDHQSFTGRSGTFYKYEGLGCIYWHMVSKLLLTIGENIKWASKNGASKDIVNKLAKHYAEVQKGIGSHKSPKDYGAFPFEPYSHTPGMAGVQQPGMTGQVKEDIISRFFELGVNVKNGQINLHPIILKKAEFIDPKDSKSTEYNAPYFVFTFCKTTFVYLINKKEGIEILMNDGKSLSDNGYTLGINESHSIINREGKINKVLVHINPTMVQ